MRGRGLKRICLDSSRLPHGVAPRAGAWIETQMVDQEHEGAMVAPRAGAWIETSLPSCYYLLPLVAPRAGAWIETTS